MTTNAPQAHSNSPAVSVKHGTGCLDVPAPLYFERFEPLEGDPRATVVMVHGGAHSGHCYQRTASGAPGWAYLFAQQGYRVLVPDWPGTGRSGFVPLDVLTGDVVVGALRALCSSVEGPLVLLTHSMSGAYGWRLLELEGERIAAVVGVAPSPPGNIQPETPVLLETDHGIDVVTFNQRITIEKRAPHVPPRAFVDRKLVGSSTHFPREKLDEYAASLLAIPPRLLLQRQNIGGTQLRVQDPRRLAKQRVFIITGTDDFDHPRDVDEGIATWLNEQGATADFCWLGDVGVNGNGHMLMLEDNAAQIATIIMDWLEKNVDTTR